MASAFGMSDLTTDQAFELWGLPQHAPPKVRRDSKGRTAKQLRLRDARAAAAYSRRSALSPADLKAELAALQTAEAAGRARISKCQRQSLRRVGEAAQLGRSPAPCPPPVQHAGAPAWAAVCVAAAAAARAAAAAAPGGWWRRQQPRAAPSGAPDVSGVLQRAPPSPRPRRPPFELILGTLQQDPPPGRRPGPLALELIETALALDSLQLQQYESTEVAQAPVPPRESGAGDGWVASSEGTFQRTPYGEALQRQQRMLQERRRQKDLADRERKERIARRKARRAAEQAVARGVRGGSARRRKSASGRWSPTAAPGPPAAPPPRPSQVGSDSDSDSGLERPQRHNVHAVDDDDSVVLGRVDRDDWDSE
eukprot:TRINITY_DN540_c0_g2_i1.p1 TRINITY_DN540_c0_g2~~TRINITY_DN540_c0_g2_i1.p1  ORF type:complete len:389 (+),score=110.59 TRINITY_DN540_c0_g2_i1:69-1169(+)